MSTVRTVSRLVLGGLASWGVASSGLLPAGDPFTSTLNLLPLWVAGFAELSRRAERAGARRVGLLPRAFERAALIGLVVAVLVRDRLPFDRTEEPIAAGFALLLLAWGARRLVAWRPLLGTRLPDRPSALFLLLPLLVYLALLPWSTEHRPPDGDEPWYLLITHSLVHDLDAELSNNYRNGDWRGFLDRPMEPQPGDPEGKHGERYSRHNALLPLMLAPAYAVGGKLGALAVMALLTAAVAWFTLRLAARYVPDRPGEALMAYGLLALGPPLLLYSYEIWVEVPAALLALVALDAINRLPGANGDSLSPWRTERARLWWVIAVAVALLPLLKIRFMLLAAPLVALAWWHAGRPWRPLLALGGALGALAGGILLHNRLIFGNPLKIHSWQEVELHHYTVRQYLLGGSGLFWDVAFGLFACAPLWLVLLPAVPTLFARHRGLLLDLAVFVGPYMAIVVPRSEWYGGWSPPFRYALVALPLLAIALVPALAERRRFGARTLAAGLGLLTLVLTLLWVVTPGWTYNFADGRTYLLDHLSRWLSADVARLFPSSVRARPATWIWPLVTVVLVPLLWRFPRRRFGPPALWGGAALVAMALLVPVAALELPTRRIELEDPAVIKTGGHLHPDAWVIDRTRFRGSWVLREGEELTAPVVAGGRRATLAVEVQLVRHHPSGAILELWAGDRRLVTFELADREGYQRIDLPEQEWPAGEPLRLVFPASSSAPLPNGAVLDFVEISWR
ncbi:MAG TPA: hypothetical protein VF017_07535 [Thermoanaerobaculia bacterium]|nr:hypothetical protein [Thermoanaerobaculia bacterium]